MFKDAWSSGKLKRYSKLSLKKGLKQKMEQFMWYQREKANTGFSCKRHVKLSNYYWNYMLKQMIRIFFVMKIPFVFNIDTVNLWRYRLTQLWYQVGISIPLMTMESLLTAAETYNLSCILCLQNRILLLYMVWINNVVLTGVPSLHITEIRLPIFLIYFLPRQWCCNGSE